MAVEVTLNTPLADALTPIVQAKLSEEGWTTGGLDDSALGEYIILMLVNGKTEDQISTELSTDLLSLPPDDITPKNFARWLFAKVESIHQQLNGLPPQLHSAVQNGPTELERTQQIEQGASIRGAAMRQPEVSGAGDAEMSIDAEDSQDGAVPTGPKSMRNGSQNGNRRMMGQLSKAMDRTGDAALHRVRTQQGTERINMHSRQPPRGPRNDLRGGKGQAGLRTGSMQNNMAQNGAAPTMQMTPQQQMQLMAMFEEQTRMMAQILPPHQQQQMFMSGPNQPAINPAFNGSHNSGKSLFDRVEQNPRKHNNHKGQRNATAFQSNKNHISGMEIDQGPLNGDISSSMEVESSQHQELSPDSLCKFNLKCTKKDCPYAHQSPAAPPGTTIDVTDTCPFGAACKNKKCTGRHPSPFQRVAHAVEQDCKFFPNCANPTCPFRHPTMPMCKFGADCNREDCKYTHVKVMCKFNPCLNPECPYKHAEGQKRGKFGDKVWTAEGAEEHVSERKFVDNEMGDEELIIPEDKKDDQGTSGRQHSPELVT